MKKISVEVQKDHLDKIAGGKPVPSIAELIWNALDADSTAVEVLFQEGLINTDQIIIKDNGHGIDHSEAEHLFSSLGGSWKKIQEKSKTKRRFLHGQEGKGRFKAFALGRIVEWNIRYEDNGKIYEYNVYGKADDIKYFEISAPKVAEHKQTGVTVKISELHKQFKLLDADYAIEKLSPIFTIYLSKYTDCSVRIGGQKIDPKELILGRYEIELPKIQYENLDYDYSLEIIEWKVITEREVQLCNSHGFPLEKYDKQFRGIGDYSFTAYIKSEHITKLNEKGLLGLSDLEPTLRPVLEQARDKIRDHFINKKLEESKSLIDSWKDENVYPYHENTISAVEEAERQVFDIVAINVSENIPEFEKIDQKTKAFQFRLLKQAIEKSPEELQMIVSEVLQLPEEKRGELAELLKETTLSSIISASKLVSDRLKFLTGLESIIFNKETKKVLKERSQLHRILAKNTWIFGDSFTLTVDDKSLTEVLIQHKECLEEDIIIDQPVTRLDGKTGIVDLMLSRAIGRNHPDEREHLVIELKAPKVPIGQKEITQIESYAFAVSADERFRNINTKWTFCVISNELTDYAKRKTKQTAYSDGVIHRSNDDGVDITIVVKTWSEIFQECKHRMQFIKEKLDLSIGSEQGLEHLKEKYSEYTKGVLVSDTEVTEP